MDENPYKSPEVEDGANKPSRSLLERLTWGPLFSPETLWQKLFGPRWAVLLLLAVLLAIFVFLASVGMLGI